MTELEIKEKEYINYINEHKSNVKLVFIKYGEKLCKALNISIYSLEENINIHDQSKFSEEEFDAYRNYFYTCSDEEKDEKAFNKAWKHHYKYNPHHPQYWKRDGYSEDMPPIYIAEMLCDWEAMSMKFNKNTYEYYKKEKNKKEFSDNTKQILDTVVKDIFG